MVVACMPSAFVHVWLDCCICRRQRLQAVSNHVTARASALISSTCQTQAGCATGCVPTTALASMNVRTCTWRQQNINTHVAHPRADETD
jgi:hypothetical protein